jgi:16S rRNA C967 or C1407 C5-methylase (RsmB/RsmF family)
LRSALTDQEKNWLDQCEKVSPDDLMERHRHNLPEWLVQPLKDQLGDEFWPWWSLNQGAGLDLRVNTFKAKRADVQKELAKAGIKAVNTPYSPWGLRIAGKPALNKHRSFLRGDFRGAGRRLAAAVHAAGRQARRDGGGLLCRRRWQDAGHWCRHAQHRAPVRV